MSFLISALMFFSRLSFAQPRRDEFAQIVAKATRQLAEPSLTKKQERSILRELIPIGPDLAANSYLRADWAQLVGQHALRSPEFLEECLRTYTLGRAIADAMADFATARILLTLDPAFACFLGWMTLVTERRGDAWFAEWTATLGDLVEPSVYWVLTEGLARKRLSRKTWERLSYGVDLLSIYHRTFIPSPRVMAWALKQLDLALDPSWTFRKLFARTRKSFVRLCQEHLVVYLLEHAKDFGMQIEIQEKVSSWLSQNYQPILNRYTPRILDHFEDSVDHLSPTTRDNLARLFAQFRPGQFPEFGRLRCGATLTAP